MSSFQPEGRSLRILQLYNDCGPGGAERLIVDLARILLQRGHQVSMVGGVDGWLAEQLRASGVETQLVPKHEGPLDMRAASRIMGFAREWKADVLHAHEFPMMVALAPLAFLDSVPLVATVHGRELIAGRRRRRYAVRLAATVCRRVVAVSRAIERFLMDEVRISKSKVETVYNGIDVAHFSQDGDGDGLRRSLGLDDGARVIGSVGSLYPVKGQKYLLHAMKEVAEKIPHAVCLIAGRGELLSTLQREAATLGLNERVRFLGFRSDIPKLLSLMEIFVLPSLSEGLPLCALEAHAASKPVVATRVGGNPEVVEDGKTGYLVPPGDPKMLADRILRLLGNPTDAAAMGRRGRLRVQDDFGLEAMTQNYLSLYRRCLSGDGC